MASEHVEVERKYDVGDAFVLPDLTGVPGVATVAEPVEHALEAVYYDTADLRLARGRITLRRRTGGTDAGWHLKLPAAAGARRELHSPLGRAARTPPKGVLAPVLGFVRSAPVTQVALLRTRRVVTELLDAEGGVLAEVADDHVTGTALPAEPGEPAVVTAWREVEVELVTGDDDLLAAVGAALLAAGAAPGRSPSKLTRVLADRLAALTHLPRAAASGAASPQASGDDAAGTEGGPAPGAQATGGGALRGDVGASGSGGAAEGGDAVAVSPETEDGQAGARGKARDGKDSKRGKGRKAGKGGKARKKRSDEGGDRRRSGTAGTGEQTAGEVVRAALGAKLAALLDADLMVRTDQPDGVHQVRVACRRLRSVLAAFRPLLVLEQTERLRDGLQWIGTQLSGSRDAEVALAHLRELVAGQPSELVLGPVAARLQQEDLREGLAGAKSARRLLTTPRYLQILDALAELVADPALDGPAAEPAGPVLSDMLAGTGKRLRRRVRAARDTDDPVALHDVRKAAKRLRYTAEVAAPVLGTAVEELVGALQAVQDVLGARQDTVVTRQLCTRVGLQAFAAGENTWTYGRLHALEEARSEEAEREFWIRWPELRRMLKAART